MLKVRPGVVRGRVEKQSPTAGAPEDPLLVLKLFRRNLLLGVELWNGRLR
jgi:hypothetical protein